MYDIEVIGGSVILHVPLHHASLHGNKSTLFCLLSGYYIHHIDDFVALRKLELNFRPPEEYFFYLKPCDDETIQRLLSQKLSQCKDTTLPSVSDVTSCTSNSSTLTRTAIPDIAKSSIKRKDSKKSKTKASPITPKPGMLSCFGLGSFRKKKDKTKKK